MGTDPQDGAGPEYFSTQGRATAHQETTKETGGWELVIPLVVGGNGGSRIRGDREICQEETEYGHTIYCNVINYGPL